MTEQEFEKLAEDLAHRIHLSAVASGRADWWIGVGVQLIALGAIQGIFGLVSRAYGQGRVHSVLAALMFAIAILGDFMRKRGLRFKAFSIHVLTCRECAHHE